MSNIAVPTTIQNLTDILHPISTDKIHVKRTNKLTGHIKKDSRGMTDQSFNGLSPRYPCIVENVVHDRRLQKDPKIHDHPILSIPISISTPQQQYFPHFPVMMPIPRSATCKPNIMKHHTSSNNIQTPLPNNTNTSTRNSVNVHTTGMPTSLDT